MVGLLAGHADDGILEAADLGQLDEALHKALAREIAKFGRQIEHQPIAVGREFGARQHIRHRRADEIGDTQHSAQRPRPLLEAGWGQFADARRDRLVKQADVPIEDGKRQIGATGMVDADEGGVGQDAETLLAAIVGMGTPSDIGNKAGRRPQAFLVVGFLDAEQREGRFGPGDQFLV